MRFLISQHSRLKSSQFLSLKMFKNSYFCIISIIGLSVLFVQGGKLCGPNQFRCRNGRGCVAAVDVCDNEFHCKDSSDENHFLCSGNFSSLTRTVKNECNPGMYRCRFGGCIDASKLCNGNFDCFDSSDETTDLCRKNRCQGKRFRCDYGGCVRNTKACDGRSDCADSSDESRKVCGKRSCPVDHFKCTYGACIPNSKVCNGQRNCIDNSDESKKLCEKNSTSTTASSTTTAGTEIPVESVTLRNTLDE